MTTEEKGQLTFKAVKVDDQGVITLCASSIAKDGDADTVQKAAMHELAYGFCAGEKRVFPREPRQGCADRSAARRVLHRRSHSQERKVAEPGVEITADDPFDHVKTMDADKACNTHWFVSVRPTDPEVVKAAKEGKIVGSSWGGLAVKLED